MFGLAFNTTQRPTRRTYAPKTSKNVPHRERARVQSHAERRHYQAPSRRHRAPACGYHPGGSWERLCHCDSARARQTRALWPLRRPPGRTGGADVWYARPAHVGGLRHGTRVRHLVGQDREPSRPAACGTRGSTTAAQVHLRCSQFSRIASRAQAGESVAPQSLASTPVMS